MSLPTEPAPPAPTGGAAEPPPTLIQQILKSDLPASFVVFLIAIPLSLGIALASGAPVMAGLIAGVVGGIVAGALGGSALQVSGPAAGLTVIVFGIVQQFGWAGACAITAVAGLVQLGFGFARIARGALAISPAVVHGMLAGIGITIALSQLHIVLGGKPEHSALENIKELPGQIADLHTGAAFLGLITIGILASWKYMPAPIRVAPGPLVAVTVATLISVLTPLGADVVRVDLPAKLFEDHVLPQWPAHKGIGEIAVAILTVALIASVESLLSAVAVDKLHSGARADLDRELIGQGAANTVSGLLGGLPVTGVIVRSSANVAAGAQTRASAILHGVWILLFVALLGTVIEKIPLAVLAGLLVHVGVSLVKWHDIKELTHHREILVYGVTVAGVVFRHLLDGVIMGIAVAVILLLRRLAYLKVTTEPGNERWHVTVQGSLTFLSVPNLTKALSQIPANAHVDVDLQVDFMDHAAFESLHNWRLSQERAGGSVDIDEIHEAWYADAVAGHPRKDKSAGNGKEGRRGVIAPGGLTNLFRGRRNRAASAMNAAIPDATPETRGELPTRSPVVDGAREFQRVGAEMVRPALAELARDGQTPHDLFIACSDSRVLPHIFTASGPGDLFKIRNIGNLIPPYTPETTGEGANDASVAAAIDFSLDVLNVPGIAVCGHSGCGAMRALLENADLTAQPHLAAWLNNGRASLARYNRGEVPDPTLPPHDQLSQVNVVQQVENLLTYPKVRERYENGTLSLVGMYFDIPNAQVYLLDPDTRAFRPISEAEADAATSGLIPVGAAH
jgi:carbonic anhydrase